MIRSRDLNKEIKALELVAEKGDDKAVGRAIVKGIALVLKVIRDVKTNQVTDLVKKYGKDILIKPNTPTEGKRTEGKGKKEEETKE